MPGRASAHDHRVTAAGGAGLGRRHRSADGNRTRGSSYPRTHSHAHCNFAARLRAERTFSCSCQRKQPGKSSRPGEKLNHPAEKPVHSRERKRRKKKKNRSSNAGQGEAAEVDFLLASPGAPGRGACRRRAGQRGALAGSGRGAPVPPAPAGSMNESAWK